MLLTWWSLIRNLIGQLRTEGPKCVDDGSFDPALESRDPIESLRQFVGVVVHLRGGQIRGSKATEQQGQKEVQHLLFLNNHSVNTGCLLIFIN